MNEIKKTPGEKDNRRRNGAAYEKMLAKPDHPLSFVRGLSGRRNNLEQAGTAAVDRCC